MPRNIFVWGEKNEHHTLMTFPAGSGVPGPTPTGVLMPHSLGSGVGFSVGWAASGYHGEFSDVAPVMYELSATHKLLPQYDGWHIVDCSNPSAPVVGPAFNPTVSAAFAAFFPISGSEDVDYNTSPGNWGLTISPSVAFWGTSIFFLALGHGATAPFVGGTDLYIWEIEQCAYDPGSLTISQTLNSQALSGYPAWMEMLSPSMLLVTGASTTNYELTGGPYLRFPITGGAIQPSPDASAPGGTWNPPFPTGYGAGLEATEPPWHRASTAGPWGPIGTPIYEGSFNTQVKVTLSGGYAYAFLTITYQSDPSAGPNPVSATVLMPDASIVTQSSVPGSSLAFYPPPAYPITYGGSNMMWYWSLADVPNEFYVTQVYVDPVTYNTSQFTPDVTFFIERYTVSDAGVVAFAEIIELENYPSAWPYGGSGFVNAYGQAGGGYIVPGVGGLYNVYGVVFEPATMSLGDVIAEPLAEIGSYSPVGSEAVVEVYAGPGWAPNVDFIGYQLTDDNKGFGGAPASGPDPGATATPPFIMPTDLAADGFIGPYPGVVTWGDSLAVTSYISGSAELYPGTGPAFGSAYVYYAYADLLRVDLLQPCLGTIAKDFTLTAGVKFGSPTAALTTGQWSIGGLIIGEAETEADTGTTPPTIHLNVTGPPPYGLFETDLTAVVTGGEGIGVAFYAEWFFGEFNDTAAYPSSISPTARIASTGFDSWTPTSGTATLTYHIQAVGNIPPPPFFPISTLFVQAVYEGAVSEVVLWYQET